MMNYGGAVCECSILITPGGGNIPISLIICEETEALLITRLGT